MEQDVPIILDFLEVFLVYLYFVPAKIAAIQEKHKKTLWKKPGTSLAL